MSSILVDNINEIPEFILNSPEFVLNSPEQNFHYLMFGPQNNPWGTYIISKNIGNYVGFKVPSTINQNNWNQYEGLNQYFESIYFDPNDLMMSDCSTCGDRWEEDDVFIIESYNEIQEFHQDKKWTFTPVHFLEFSDNQVTCNKIEWYGNIDEDEIMNEQQVCETYDWMQRKNRFKWD